MLSSTAKLGMSVETLLNLGRGIVQEGLLVGVDLRRRRLLRRTKCYGFPIATQY